MSQKIYGEIASALAEGVRNGWDSLPKQVCLMYSPAATRHTWANVDTNGYATCLACIYSRVNTHGGSYTTKPTYILERPDKLDEHASAKKHMVFSTLSIEFIEVIGPQSSFFCDSTF